MRLHHYGYLFFVLLTAFIMWPNSIIAQDSLFVTEDGKVGIGTNNPEQTLHVKGYLYLDQNLGGNTINYSYGQRFYKYTFEGNGYNLLLRSANWNSIIGFDRIDGSPSAPEPASNGDVIFQILSSATNENLTQTIWKAIEVTVDGTPVGNTVSQNLHFLNGRMIITHSGNVGIGTTNPQGYKLNVNGTTYCTNGAWSGSDIRWKKNIKPLEDSLGKIDKLQGVTYEWDKDLFTNQGFEDGKQIGLVAQEVEDVFPELVRTDDKGYKAMSYEKMTAVLVEAVKSLKSENEKLKQELYSRDQEWEARLDRIETKLSGYLARK